ncbi:MAG: DUF1467 family protein [Pseudoruegeria sp.]
MTITAALVLFAVIWFMVLFLVLPLRLKTQGDLGEIAPGTPAGAPAEFSFRKKAIVVTIVTVILWTIIAGIIISGVISIRDIDYFNRMSTPS